jgi:hypothetical protein
VIIRVGEQSPRLFEVEDAFLAEYVHRLGKTQAGDFGMNLVDQPAHPDFRVVTMFQWDLVRRQAGRMEVDRVLAAGFVDDLQYAHLGLEVEPVAGFGLGGGRAVEQKPVESFEGRREELVSGRGPGCLHRGVDATAGSRDVHVGLAAEPSVELLLPRARPYRVGVGVDEAGQNATAGGVEGLFRLAETALRLVFIADEHNTSIVAVHHRLGLHVEGLKVSDASRAAPGRGDDLVGAPNEEAHPPFSVWLKASRWMLASCGVEGSSRSRR